MIVCDDFVFLHLHKSGGTFINHLLMKTVPSARMLGYHLPYAMLPDQFRHLPVLGTVRNPWAYYVSWYHFQNGMPQPNPLFVICSDNRRLDFTGTIRNLVMLHADETRVRRLAELFPVEINNRGLNLTKACISSILVSQKGFYSFLYDRHYSGVEQGTFIPMERLRQDLMLFLDKNLSGPKAEASRFVVEAPIMNTSQHGHYAGYYNSELRELVAIMDKDVIARHGYAFESA
ncbi:MAG: sulfotransferase domain-containing protein [Asticcacaulis sp.]